MQRKDSAMNHSFLQNQNHQNSNPNQLLSDPMVYQQGPMPMGNQYVNSQAGYYPGQAMMNAPPTPFDTAYGVTLLPSHLLMGSPFICSPDLFQQGHQQQSRQPFNQYSMSASSNRGPSKMVNTYPPPPSLNAAPVSRNSINSRRSSYYQLIQGSPNSKLFQEPFVITYTVLPKGNDEFRTRSLLFENVNNSVELHSFVNKYSKYGPIESIFLFKDPENESNNSILLSFLSGKVCLDSYNSVLQRFAEFKTGLDSKSLALSFVSLKYKVHEHPEGIKDNDDDCSLKEFEKEDDTSLSEALNVTATASLHYDIVNRGATRSIAICFNKPYTKDELFSKRIAFLNKKNNKRYVLETIDLVNAKENTRHFSQNYAILTFLNISMAIELLDYVRLNSKELGVEKCFFVTVMNQNTTDSSKNNLSLSVNGSSHENISTNHKSKNGSLSSLGSSGSSVSLNQEIEQMSSKLQGIDLNTHVVEIKPENYPNAFFMEHDDHLQYVNVSEAAFLDLQFSEPQSKDMQLNESSVSSRESSISNDLNMLQHSQSRRSMSTQMLPMQQQIPVDQLNPVYFVKSSNLRQNMIKPITQSLQRQYATSAEVASLMGGGVGNRTIYIGNIHPRSKPEDICNVVRGGILQSVKFLKEKHICFVTFIEASTAVQFYTNAFIDPIVLHGNMLKVGWGHHPGPLPKSIALAVTIGASRNVYVSLPEYSFKDKYINDPQYQEYLGKYKIPTEEQLREDFGHYGDIEQINYLSDGHCCWINFMNISAAIRLVEEVKNDDGEKFHLRFNNRYKGLIIGYGKDRCGNVNKNLVAGKNSRFYKKVKKPSYNIRLNKMEEERRQNEEAFRNQHKKNNDQAVQFGSLGITLEGNGSKSSNSDNNIKMDESNDEAVDQQYSEKSDEEREELLKLSNESAVLSSLGITANSLGTKHRDHIGTEENNDIDENESVNSDLSTDIELIIHTPVDDKAATQNGQFCKEEEVHNLDDPSERQPILRENFGAAFFDVTSVNPTPPIAPATISRNYSLMVKHQHKQSRLQYKDRQNYSQSQPRSQSKSQYNNNGHSGENHNRSKRNKKRNAKTIPGSDVMAQYLAQLQHSTFMYAANVLGATGDTETNYYDDVAN